MKEGFKVGTGYMKDYLSIVLDRDGNFIEEFIIIFFAKMLIITFDYSVIPGAGVRRGGSGEKSKIFVINICPRYLSQQNDAQKMITHYE